MRRDYAPGEGPMGAVLVCAGGMAVVWAAAIVGVVLAVAR